MRQYRKYPNTSLQKPPQATPRIQNLSVYNLRCTSISSQPVDYITSKKACLFYNSEEKTKSEHKFQTVVLSHILLSCDGSTLNIKVVKAQNVSMISAIYKSSDYNIAPISCYTDGTLLIFKDVDLTSPFEIELYVDWN